MVKLRTEFTVGGKSNTIVSALLKSKAGWADLFERVHLKANMPLVQMSMRPPHAYFPIDAVISELVTPDGPKNNELTTNMLGSKDIVGLQGLLDNSFSGSYAYVDIEGSAIRCSTQAARRFIAEHKSSMEILLAYGAASHAESLQWLTFNLQRSVTERVAAYLYWLYDLSGSTALPVTQRGISKRTGIRRPSITEKAVPTLTQMGFIAQVEDGRIDVRDAVGLKLYVEDVWPLYGHYKNAFVDALTLE